MELRSILSADYLDIIFDNRNKSYGGYELRKHYNRRTLRSITLVLSAVLLLLGLQAFKQESTPNTIFIADKPTDFSDLVWETPPPPLKIEPPAQASVAATTAFTPLKIEPDENVIEAPPTIEDMKDREIGTVNSEGNGGTDAATTDIIPTGEGRPGNSFVEKPAVPAEPVVYVSQMPEFNGNVHEYLSRNIRYPQMARDANITGKVTIRFVVNEDGSISNAKVIKGIGGGCEEEAIRVINSMPKWKPGKNNGKAVKVFMTLPVKFVMN